MFLKGRKSSICFNRIVKKQKLYDIYTPAHHPFCMSHLMSCLLYPWNPLLQQACWYLVGAIWSVPRRNGINSPWTILTASPMAKGTGPSLSRLDLLMKYVVILSMLPDRYRFYFIFLCLLSFVWLPFSIFVSCSYRYHNMMSILHL